MLASTVFSVSSHCPGIPSVRRLAAGLDLLVQPVVHLRFDPADGAAAKRYGGKS